MRRIGHTIHTTTVIPLIDRTTRYEIPVLSVTRTLIDIARTTSPEVLTIALDSAMRDGGTSEDFLHRRINALRASGRQGPKQLLAVIAGAEIIRGGQSWLEREMLRLLDATGLLRPTTQVVLGRRGNTFVRVDFYFPGTAIIVEVLGYRWHRSGAQMSIDAQRANSLLLTGFIPLQFTCSQIVEDASMVTGTIRLALAGHPGDFF